MYVLYCVHALCIHEHVYMCMWVLYCLCGCMSVCASFVCADRIRESLNEIYLMTNV